MTFSRRVVVSARSTTTTFIRVPVFKTQAFLYTFVRAVVFWLSEFGGLSSVDRWQFMWVLSWNTVLVFKWSCPAD